MMMEYRVEIFHFCHNFKSNCELFSYELSPVALAEDMVVATACTCNKITFDEDNSDIELIEICPWFWPKWSSLLITSEILNTWIYVILDLYDLIWSVEVFSWTWFNCKPLHESGSDTIDEVACDCGSNSGWRNLIRHWNGNTISWRNKS